ncbi:BolA family transcriptional regulator [Aurantimonas sp. VKM B-3413]|uniref:BolA family protein n=1 Tax=Aurantimonas sp. VKM B-3413 TaxID=2779401 RepID=UPI001E2F0647|nr:BolA family transcriptional regulator [Aurantimonas sp. VKM B-3413]MCB8837356.1 BolA family transcriptional regulator [Aurantimonas sp. VKM B-3413]
MSTKATIEKKLTEAFQPERLVVIDESHMHAGHHHAGDPGGSDHHAAFDGSGETHFRVRLISGTFAGQSRVARHRAINAALKDELSAGVHALAIEAAAPGEAVRWA